MLNPDPVLQTSISLPFITATADGPKHIETNLSRAKFEELANDLLERCRIPVEQALKDANLAVSDINEVILVGGSTRIPAVQVCFYPVISSSIAAGEVHSLVLPGGRPLGNRQLQDCHEARHLAPPGNLGALCSLARVSQNGGLAVHSCGSSCLEAQGGIPRSRSPRSSG